ncbi:aspartyl protease family protein [Dyella subtropica]|uniref:aspartyl protease family protein n=1 Tax=Dyella subtropica TaxID=2992127 RepID=UPI00224CC943|nr:aspartyl protease family protein [Dyella subtropica]
MIKLKLRPLSRLLLIGSLLLPTFASADDAHDLLRQLQQAHGAAALQHHAALVAEGKEESDGLSGSWNLTVDLRNGHFAEHARNPVFTGADGYDAQGRWHQDISGLIHPNDSDEATTVAISENWLRRFGFLSTGTDDVNYRRLPDAEEKGHRFARLEATPAGGRAMTLWIDPTTHRLDHVSWQSSFLTFTQQYSDYRAVNGVQLPFRISSGAATAAGGLDNASTDIVSRYQWLDTAPTAALQRPDGKVRDVTMAHGASQAVVPMHLEGGFLLVDVSINGKGPLPFILDTGGHAILTIEAAKKLGFSTQGQGVSTGSGPGSMTTAYTHVDHLGMGDADIRDQTFLVMPYPYAMCERGEGREPVAGILGLEIFERFAVTFDYDHQQLILQPYDQGQAPAARQGNVLPLRFTDDMPLTDAELDDHRGTFGIDTGNSGLVLLFPQWAERTGIADRYTKGTPAPTGGVGGQFTAHFSHTRSLKLGEQKLDNVVAMLTRADAAATGNPSEAGNIGQDVLSRYNVHFDYRRQQMVLMPRTETITRHYAMAGFRADKPQEQPDRYVISWVIPGSPAEQAGLKKDDAITAVNGKAAKTIGLGELRDANMLLPEGTPLKLTLSDGRTLDMKLRDMAPK